MIGLVITMYSRADYVGRCFDWLSRADLSGVKVILVDDCSPEVMPELPGADLIIKHTRNAGVKVALMNGIDAVIEMGCDEFIVLDSDAIVRPNFVSVLKTLKEATRKPIVSGFRTAADGGRGTRRSCGGVNMFFGIDAYRKYVLPALMSRAQNWDFEATKTLDVPLANPSVVQHIGYRSSLGHDSTVPDHSPDFKEFQLPDVTLALVKASPRVGTICRMNIEFGRVAEVEDPRELPGVVRTSHALMVTDHGYIIRPESWQPRWLDYTRIGDPSGFCLQRMDGGGMEAKETVDGFTSGPLPFGFSGKDTNLSHLPRFLQMDAGVPRAYSRHLDRVGFYKMKKRK